MRHNWFVFGRRQYKLQLTRLRFENFLFAPNRCNCVTFFLTVAFIYALMILMTMMMNYFTSCCRQWLLTKPNQTSYVVLEFRMNECDVQQSNFVVQLIVVIKFYLLLSRCRREYRVAVFV